jgi:hypothetical protein
MKRNLFIRFLLDKNSLQDIPGGKSTGRTKQEKRLAQKWKNHSGDLMHRARAARRA